MKRLLTDDGNELVLDLIDRGGDGRIVARAPLSRDDLQLVRDETWWRGVRAGALEPDLAAHELRVSPGRDAGRGRCAGIHIELRAGRRSYRRHFPVETFAAVARRKMLELVEQDAAAATDTFNYFLTAIPAEHDELPQAALHSTPRGEPLTFETARLADYLLRSEPLVGVSEPPEPPSQPAMEVFVTEEVWEEGRGLSRRGGEHESAAVFSGRLLRDADSPEVFMVLDACLEAEQAVEEKLAVTFTGETWSRIRKTLEQRRRRLGRPHEIIVGSAHGHPFKPAADAQGRRMCDACSIARYCNRSTATPSNDDFDWHRSVFTGQPWATLAIWGFNAREQDDWRFYGLENGALRERSLRKVQE